VIEKAYVSGQIGQSVYKHEEKFYIMYAGKSEKSRECSIYEENLFFNSGAEINVFENISVENLRETLLKEKSCFDALYFTLAGFDGSLSEGTRVLSMRGADEKRANEEIFNFVNYRLYGNPIPQEARLEEAVELSFKEGFMRLHLLYERLWDNKNGLESFHTLFKEAIFEFSLEREFEEIRNRFITRGLFYENINFTNTEKKKEAEESLPIDQKIIEWIRVKKMTTLLKQISESVPKREKSEIEDAVEFTRAIAGVEFGLLKHCWDRDSHYKLLLNAGKISQKKEDYS
jgi:hypothetical protein